MKMVELLPLPIYLQATRDEYKPTGNSKNDKQNGETASTTDHPEEAEKILNIEVMVLSKFTNGLNNLKPP